MSKVRREKHKYLVIHEQIFKYLSHVIPVYDKAPRLRQLKKSEKERSLKNE